MTTSTLDNSPLSSFTGLGGPELVDAALQTFAATGPQPAAFSAAAEEDLSLDELVDRIRAKTACKAGETASVPPASGKVGTLPNPNPGQKDEGTDPFLPQEPSTQQSTQHTAGSGFDSQLSLTFISIQGG